MSRWGIFEESVIAMLSIGEWRFLRPIFVGDTLSVRMTIIGKRPTKNGTSGIIDREFEIRNQRSEVVQQGRSDALIKLRPRDRG
jgi:acyl dehydratase